MTGICGQSGIVARWPPRRPMGLMVAGFVLLLLAGCGRKGPPVAPQTLPPTPVADLAVRLEGAMAVLSWTVPSIPPAPLPDGFRIYRARLGPDDCPGCPLLFQKIGTLDLDAVARPARGEPWSLAWQDAVEPGFRYVYKVTACTGHDRFGQDSNLVRVQP